MQQAGDRGHRRPLHRPIPGSDLASGPRPARGVPAGQRVAGLSVAGVWVATHKPTCRRISRNDTVPFRGRLVGPRRFPDGFPPAAAQVAIPLQRVHGQIEMGVEDEHGVRG